MINKEIEIKEIAEVIKKNYLLIFIFTVSFGVISILYVLNLPNIYSSTIKLMPNSGNRVGGITNMSSQLGGLASLAGINLGGGSDDKTTYALEVLKSRKFLYNFIEVNALKPLIMGAVNWDASTNKVVFDPKIYDHKNNIWTRNVDFPFKPEPSLNEVYLAFLEHHLSVIRDKETGVILVSIKYFSPNIAQKIVSELIVSLNKTIKKEEKDAALKSIEYLEQQIHKTELAEMRTMFYELIETQHKELMLVASRDEFVVKVIDYAIVPELKTSPKRAIIVIMITSLGFILIVGFILIRHFFREQP